MPAHYMAGLFLHKEIKMTLYRMLTSGKLKTGDVLYIGRPLNRITSDLWAYNDKRSDKVKIKCRKMIGISPSTLEPTTIYKVTIVSREYEGDREIEED